MSKLNDLIEELCPEGVQHKPLGEVGVFTRGSGLQKKDFVDDGIGCIHYGQVYTHYGLSATRTISFVTPEFAKNKRKVKPGDVFIATTSENDEDLGKAVAWLGDEEIVASGDGYIFHHELLAEYVSYFLNSGIFQQQKKRWITGTKVRRISGAALESIIIPVPPLPVQQEIVRILDKFTQLEAELETELEARKKQYDHYRISLLSFSDSDVEWRTLGDIGRISMCKRVFKAETSATGDIPFYKIGTFGKSADAYISRDLFEEYRSKYSFPKKGDVLISAAGTIGRAIVYDGMPAYFQDSNIVWIDNDEEIVSNAFLRHWYGVIQWATDGGIIRRLYNSNIRRAKIAVPSRLEQERIVSILDSFEALIHCIDSGIPAEKAARRKQYEYYRDRLLTFKELSA